MNLRVFSKHAIGLSLAVAGASTNAVVHRFRGKISHADRAAWLHRWCAFLLRQLSVCIEVRGPLPAGTLIVSNHLSYLDILVFAAMAPCAFVSKQEVRKWPIFGAFAAIAGTIFVDRERPQLARTSVEEMQQTLASGVRVILFPEGTSTSGQTVLPFKPALFESAVSTKQPIAAAHLRYAIDDGDASQLVCWWGEMPFTPHLLRLMATKRVYAIVTFDANAQVFTDRKLAAAFLHRRVMALHQRTD